MLGWKVVRILWNNGFLFLNDFHQFCLRIEHYSRKAKQSSDWSSAWVMITTDCCPLWRKTLARADRLACTLYPARTVAAILPPYSSHTLPNWTQECGAQAGQPLFNFPHQELLQILCRAASICLRQTYPTMPRRRKDVKPLTQETAEQCLIEICMTIHYTL